MFGDTIIVKVASIRKYLLSIHFSTKGKGSNLGYYFSDLLFQNKRFMKLEVMMWTMFLH